LSLKKQSSLGQPSVNSRCPSKGTTFNLRNQC
jgi:hypothetical protein